MVIFWKRPYLKYMLIFGRYFGTVYFDFDAKTRWENVKVFINSVPTLIIYFIANYFFYEAYTNIDRTKINITMLWCDGVFFSVLIICTSIKHIYYFWNRLQFKKIVIECIEEKMRRNSKNLNELKYLITAALAYIIIFLLKNLVFTFTTLGFCLSFFIVQIINLTYTLNNEYLMNMVSKYLYDDFLLINQDLKNAFGSSSQVMEVCQKLIEMEYRHCIKRVVKYTNFFALPLFLNIMTYMLLIVVDFYAFTSNIRSGLIGSNLDVAMIIWTLIVFVFVYGNVWYALRTLSKSVQEV